MTGLIPVALPQTAAPSLACGRERTPAEQTICADPELARADLRMATAYRTAMAALSPIGAALMRDGQRRFVGWTQRECVPGGLAFLGSGDGKPQTFGHCLLLAFQQRGQALATAVKVAGGVRLQAMHSWRTRHTGPSDDGNLPPLLDESITSVRIDVPKFLGTRVWNTAIARRIAHVRRGVEGFDEVDGPGTSSIEVEVAVASRELISATLGMSTYFDGPHPSYHSETLTWSLPLGRAIRVADLFAYPAAPALRRLVTAHNRAGGYPIHDGCDAPPVERSKFTVDRQGVIFHFDPYELGGYSCSGDSRVSWAALTPFLRRPLLFRTDRLQAPRPVVAAGRAR